MKLERVQDLGELRIPSSGLGVCQVAQLTEESRADVFVNIMNSLVVLKEACAMSREQFTKEARFINDIRPLLFYGASFYVVLDAQERVVSLSVAKCGSKRRCGWGKYVNLYYAYTQPTERAMGFATGLQKVLELYWRAQGQDRLKSLIASYAGFRFHWRMGHDIWGYGNERNELLVDSPLARFIGAERQDFPANSTPRHARGVTERTQAMTPGELVDFIASAKCGYRVAQTALRRVVGLENA